MTDFNTNPGSVTTADGVILGVQGQATPEMLRAQAASVNAANNPPQPPQQQQIDPATGRTFTAEDMGRARQEEKDKVYGELERIKADLSMLTTDRDRAIQEAKEAADAAAAAELAKEQEGMSAKALVLAYKAEMDGKLAEIQGQADTAQALLERERSYQAMEQFKANQLATAANDIIPHLLQYVGGDTEEQILQSIEIAKANSAAIAQDVQAQMMNQRQQQQGSRITAPPAASPLEDQQVGRDISAAQIKAMSNADYAKYRGSLMNAGRTQFYGQR